MLKTFRVPLLLTAVALLLTFLIGGTAALITVTILAVLELSFSFDNAVVNAKILTRMNAFWQKLFLTVGIVIAVFGMRLLFPLIIVSLAAGLNPLDAFQLALQKPNEYAQYLEHAHLSIAAFGGMFLLMLFLEWLVGEKDITWISKFENWSVRVFEKGFSPLIISVIVLTFTAKLTAIPDVILLSGIAGLVVYTIVSSLDNIFDSESSKAVAKAGIGTFLYLEVLDASFSFDGVIGAFAVSNNILLIATGLGIGALYVRGLTIYLVRKGTLNQYVFLEHGAHWAIGALALLLLMSIIIRVPELVTGLIGVSFIAAALYSSIKLNNTVDKDISV